MVPWVNNQLSPRYQERMRPLGVMAVAAEAIFGWGCKHLPRAPDSMGPQERGPLPHFYNAVFTDIFYNAVFTDIGVFFKSCQSSPQFAFVVTVQTQLQKKIKSFTNRCTQPFYLRRSLEVTGSNIEHDIVAHPEELRRNRRRQNTRTDVDTLFQCRFDLQTSPFD